MFRFVESVLLTTRYEALEKRHKFAGYISATNDKPFDKPFLLAFDLALQYLLH